MARELEYLEEALEEAEAAARWYAERSAAAAVGFSEEIDAAESAIAQFPEAWPRFDHGTRRYLLRRYPFSIVYRVEPSAFSLSQSRMGIDGLGTGSRECLANPRMEPTRRGSCAARLIRNVMPA